MDNTNGIILIATMFVCMIAIPLTLKLHKTHPGEARLILGLLLLAWGTVEIYLWRGTDSQRWRIGEIVCLVAAVGVGGYGYIALVANDDDDVFWPW